MSKIKVILPVGEIPLGSNVTKVNGSKLYVLRDRLRLFSLNPQDAKELVASPGTVLLVSETGDANAVPVATEHVWHIAVPTLMAFLQDREDEEAGS